MKITYGESRIIHIYSKNLLASMLLRFLFLIKARLASIKWIKSINIERHFNTAQFSYGLYLEIIPKYNGNVWRWRIGFEPKKLEIIILRSSQSNYGTGPLMVSLHQNDLQNIFYEILIYNKCDLDSITLAKDLKRDISYLVIKSLCNTGGKYKRI